MVDAKHILEEMKRAERNVLLVNVERWSIWTIHEDNKFSNKSIQKWKQDSVNYHSHMTR